MVRKENDCTKDTLVAMKGGPGQVERTQFVNAEELMNKGRLFCKMHLEKNCGIGFHMHENETEYFYIVDGEADYNDNGNIVHVSKGDICICNDKQSHSITTKDSTCDYIALILNK